LSGRFAKRFSFFSLIPSTPSLLSGGVSGQPMGTKIRAIPAWAIRLDGSPNRPYRRAIQSAQQAAPHPGGPSNGGQGLGDSLLSRSFFWLCAVVSQCPSKATKNCLRCGFFRDKLIYFAYFWDYRLPLTLFCSASAVFWEKNDDRF
jgi:hypothetical protein